MDYNDLGGGFYEIRTQAGYKQAAQHWGGEDVFEDHEYHPIEFPKAYPCIVVFESRYMGCCHQLFISQIKINDLRKKIEIL